MAQLGQTVSIYQNLTSKNTNINQVAFSGSYNDLNNTPVISTIGHSGQYSDILNAPTRVSQFANDVNYSIKGEPVSEFANDKQYTVNGSKISQFVNDTAYTVNGSNVSQFANDKNYAVKGEPVSEFANDKQYTVNGSNVSQFANDKQYTVNGSNVSQFANDIPYATVSQLSSSGVNSVLAKYTAPTYNGGGTNLTGTTKAPLVQAGVVTITNGIPAIPSGSGSYGFTITFATPFSSLPAVTCSTDGYYTALIHVGTLTTTGFRMDITNSSGYSGYVCNNIFFHAIGY